MNVRYSVYLVAGVAVWHSLLLASAIAADTSVVSPDGKIELQLLAAPDGLGYTVLFDGQTVIEPSTLAMLVDGTNLSQDAKLGAVNEYSVDERYATRGVHAEAHDHCRGAKIAVAHAASGSDYTLEIRVYNDGVAFRHVIPGDGERIPDEAHQFTFPAGSTVWHHAFRGHYEGVHKEQDVERVSEGTWCAPPLTVKLPAERGYASVSEGALIGYSGLGLQAGENRTWFTRLGHAHPVSYPFELRFGEEEAERLSHPAAVSGTITTPWRIVMIGADLNTLVNCDIVNNVSPAPDPKLFPEGIETAWLKPGRSVWKYLDGGESSLAGMKEFSRLAGELGFEYNLIEGFWRRWSNDELRELVDFSRERGVGILLWQHSGQLRTPEARREFYGLCRDAGVAGVKIDFLDHEAKEIIDLYQVLLREAAEHQLIVNFHGANKPAGEARTWPNELTREAVTGMERSRMTERAEHNATLPFTRYLAGHADYTAVHFGDRRGDTTWTHQIASAAVFTSPLLVYGAHPKRLLDNPAVEMIKSIPGTWDETIALPSCEIGRVAAVARRHGDTWFLAVINGPESRTLKTPLSFLSAGDYDALLVRDKADDPASLAVEQMLVQADDSLAIDLSAGGGFIAQFQSR